MDEQRERPIGLRIGELADLVGTTVRTVRHYHAKGLLPEPPRDASGYRRYAPDQVVTLVRILRMRSLGMPLEGIAQRLPAGPTDQDQLEATLGSLADDLERQIQALRETQVRLRGLIASHALEDPAAGWADALKRHGLLPTTGLPAAEERAARLLDSLHPEGIDGAVRAAEPLMSDPAKVSEIGALLERFRRVTSEQVESLAVDLAGAFPEPDRRVPSVDPQMMDRLLGDRLTAPQRACLLRMREIMAARSTGAAGSDRGAGA